MHKTKSFEKAIALPLFDQNKKTCPLSLSQDCCLVPKQQLLLKCFLMLFQVHLPTLLKPARLCQRPPTAPKEGKARPISRYNNQLELQWICLRCLDTGIAGGLEPFQNELKTNECTHHSDFVFFLHSLGVSCGFEKGQ